MKRYISHELMGRPIQGQMCLFLISYGSIMTEHIQSRDVMVNTKTIKNHFGHTLD